MPTRKRQAPSGQEFYYAFIDSKGRRAKANKPGARRVKIKINRAALRKAAKRAGRVGGKFATGVKAKRVRAAKKAKATRKLNSLGVSQVKVKFRKRNGRPRNIEVYSLPAIDVSAIEAALERARISGAVSAYGIVDYLDSDGDEMTESTGQPVDINEPESAENLAAEFEALISNPRSSDEAVEILNLEIVCLFSTTD